MRNIFSILPATINRLEKWESFLSTMNQANPVDIYASIRLFRDQTINCESDSDPNSDSEYASPVELVRCLLTRFLSGIDWLTLSCLSLVSKNEPRSPQAPCLLFTRNVYRRPRTRGQRHHLAEEQLEYNSDTARSKNVKDQSFLYIYFSSRNSPVRFLFNLSPISSGVIYCEHSLKLLSLFNLICSNL